MVDLYPLFMKPVVLAGSASWVVETIDTAKISRRTGLYPVVVAPPLPPLTLRAVGAL